MSVAKQLIIGCGTVLAILMAAVVFLIYDDMRSEKKWQEYARDDLSKKTQIRLIGRVIADENSLIYYANDVAWNDGVIVWRYRVDKRHPEILKLCGNQNPDTCHFFKRIFVKHEDQRTLDYRNGILELTLIWS